MPSSSLRPLLRTSVHLSSPSSSYVCQQCRHARLLRRPKRPYTFTQLVTLSDGSAFTLRTTSPTPVYRSTRDTKNAPLWNPRSKELLNVEDDDAGRLAGFRARFGGGYDTQRDTESDGATRNKAKSEDQIEFSEVPEGMETSADSETDKLQSATKEQAKSEAQPAQRRQYEGEDVGEDWDFGDEDENVLDLISRFGQEETSIPKDIPIAGKKRK